MLYRLRGVLGIALVGLGLVAFADLTLPVGTVGSVRGAGVYNTYTTTEKGCVAGQCLHDQFYTGTQQDHYMAIQTSCSPCTGSYQNTQACWCIFCE